MTSVQTPAAEDSWGAAAADDVILHRQTREQDVAREQAATVESFAALVARDGAQWRDRLAAALQIGCEAFNARAGYPMIRVTLGASGLISAHAGDNGYLLIATDLAPDSPGRSGAGVMVTTLLSPGVERNRDVRPHAFVRDGAALAVEIAGEALGPEAAARRLAEPWLQTFNLRGR